MTIKRLIKMNSISSHITTIFLFLLFLSIKGQDEYMDESQDGLIAELQITDLELQDDCENLARTLKTSLETNTFTEKIKVRKTHGDLLKVLAKNVRPLGDELPGELVRNWTFFTHPGDALLAEQDWSTLVHFDVANDEAMHTETVHCKNGTEECIFVKKGYETLLEHSKNETILKKSWSAWQTLMSSQRNHFPDILNLVNKAAQENEQDNAKAYWEMLADQSDLYSVADNLWEEIKPLYFKLQGYVKARLFRFYNITSTDSDIPVYLLGSNFGNDWSKIAGTLLPYPQIYYEAEAYINQTRIQDIYKSAEELTKTMSLGGLGDQFWANSLFNMTFCENHLLSFCAGEHSELLTCDKTSWTSYLDAFEVATDVCLRNMDYLTLPRQNLRYSVIDEAIVGMGAVLGVKNLRHTGVWSPDLFVEGEVKHNEMAELMLIALRTLPKLPYYLAADKWRLHLLENGFGEMEESWWRFRKEYQGVVGVSNTEPDFLADPYITSNRPYLSKFLGTVLQFQFLEFYIHDWQFPNNTIAENIGKDENFRKMLHERSSIDWSPLIVNYHGFYDVSATAMLDFFSLLRDYLDTAPLDQTIVTTTKKPPPVTSTTTVKPEKSHPKLLKSVDVSQNEESIGDSVGTSPPVVHHEHIEENLEGPNPAMEKISMYIGIGLLVGVVLIVAFVLISKRVTRKKRSNNRRFET